MKSKVYMIKTNHDDEDYFGKIVKIVEDSSFRNNIASEDNVGLIVHPRDIDNSTYINRESLIKIKEHLESEGADTQIIGNDTLFHTANDKSLNNLLKEHELDMLIDDESVICKGEYELFDEIPVLKSVNDSGALIVFSHFKLHPLISFSGALKHVATGCTTRDGQIKLHRLVKPFVSRIACLACNVCVDACPEKAINVDSVAKINDDMCTGCNNCISSCPKDAIKLNRIGQDYFMKALSEFSSTCIKNKKDNKVLFINTLINIKPDYYCDNKENNIVNDIGILASFDAAAIDKASYDLINAAQSTSNENPADKFQELYKNVDGALQFEYAESMDIGNTAYELIEL